MILTHFEPEDIDVLIKLQNNVMIKSISQGYLFPHTKNAVIEWVKKIHNPGKNPTNLFWAIKEENELVGYCSLTNIDWMNRNAEIGIVLIKTQQGTGPLAIQELCNVAFNSYGLEKLYAKVLQINSPAIKLFERLGFLIEGRLLKDKMFSGEMVDNLIFAKHKLEKT